MRHAEEPTARPSRVRRLLTRFVPLVLVLGLGAYVGACALAPLPEPALALVVPAEATIAAQTDPAQAAVDTQALPTALGWFDDDEVWSNDDTAYTLASISKLITVLVCLEKEPLEPGADGPTYVWTAEDRARQDMYLAMSGVAYPIPVGTEITLRQMLEFIFLPSSNDYAAAYAYWTFGDNETFLAALDAWKTKHGFASVNFVEPTGMDERNQANAADLLRIGRLALQNPTIAEFNKMPSAVMPWGIGLIENTNPLLTEMPGVIGVKTGALDAVGYNFILAQRVALGEREIVKMSVTLARPTKPARAQSGRDMLAILDTLPQQVPIVDEGERIGTLTGVDGAVVDLFAAGSSSLMLLPGEEATRTVDASASTISIASPGGNAEVPIHRSGELTDPDLWWRLTHPLALFG